MNTYIHKFLLKICPDVLRMYLRGVKLPLEIEIHLAEHCNLNCVSCLHYSPIAKPAYPDIRRLEKNLAELSKVQKWFHTVRLLGGEPLLNPDISKILNITREHMNKARIELVTNGILLQSHKLPSDFWETCRKNDIVIAISKYPIGLDYEKIKKICEANNCIFQIFGDRIGNDGFCAYKLEPLTYKKNFLKYICCSNRRCLQLVDDQIFPCSVSAYVNHINDKFGYNFRHKENDTIKIKDINLLKLLWFMSYAKPFCAYCTPRSPGFPWRQSKLESSEWINIDR